MKTLSDFMNMEIWEDKRKNVAGVIIDWHKGNPITMGFKTSNKSNFEIREEAFMFYKEFIQSVKKYDSR
jgi:hypothetical protein